MPIRQWLYFNALECLAAEPLGEEKCQPKELVSLLNIVEEKVV